MTPDDRETQARNRHVILSALRMVGALMVMAGFVLIMGKWPLIDPDIDRYFGIALVLGGMFDFAVAPLLLARSWKREGDQ